MAAPPPQKNAALRGRHRGRLPRPPLRSAPGAAGCSAAVTGRSPRSESDVAVGRPGPPRGRTPPAAPRAAAAAGAVPGDAPRPLAPGPARFASPEGRLRRPAPRPVRPRRVAVPAAQSPARPGRPPRTKERGAPRKERRERGRREGSPPRPRTHAPGSAPRGAPGPARGTSAPVAAFEQRAKWSAPRRFRVGPGRAAAAGAGRREGRAERRRRRRRKEAAAFVGLARSWRRRGGPGASPPLAHGAAPLAGGRGAERGRGAARGGHVPRGGARARGGGGVTPRRGNGGAGRRAAPGAVPERHGRNAALGFGSRTRPPGEKRRNHGGGGERGVVSSEPFKLSAAARSLAHGKSTKRALGRASTRITGNRCPSTSVFSSRALPVMSARGLTQQQTRGRCTPTAAVGTRARP